MLRMAYRKIILNPKYARNPFRRRVSPSIPTKNTSVWSVDTSKEITNPNRRIVALNSTDRKVKGLILYEFIKCPSSQPAIDNRRINLGVLNGSFKSLLKNNVTAATPIIRNQTEFDDLSTFFIL